MGGRGSLRRDFLVDNLDLPASSGVPDAQWEDFQLEFFESDEPLSVDNKSRQISWSYTLSCDFVADALLFGNDGIFVSINLEEASEKIRYAKTIYNHLTESLTGLPTLVKDNSLGLEFSNGARLSSLPAKPPRGRARSNVGLDEFAHSPKDRDIFKGALPIISKGGRLRVGSSPLGTRGIFWDLMTETTQAFPGFTRRTVPWWEIRAFCIDVGIARVQAPTMTTEERVQKFGKPRLLLIFQNTILEDFQQEYECDFGAGGEGWIDFEELMSVSDPELPWIRASSQGKELSRVNRGLDELSKLLSKGVIRPNLYLGYDIGRRRDRSEISILERIGRKFTLRGLFSLIKTPFPQQEEFLRSVWKTLRIRRGKIDETGIGMQLVENAKSRLIGVVPETFTNAKKLEWARSLKIAVQEKTIQFPVDATIQRQFTSLKRRVTDSGNIVFDVDSTESHHADVFWSVGLSLSAAMEGSANLGSPAVNAGSKIKTPGRQILVPKPIGVGHGLSFLEGIR